VCRKEKLAVFREHGQFYTVREEKLTARLPKGFENGETRLPNV
jgi:hypothetical protein